MKVVAICGSMRFFETMFAEQVRLAKEGVIALLPVIESTNNEPNLTASEKELYSQIHFQKIDMSDEILVINVNNYIGYSTSEEIKYAEKIGKPIHYMEPRN